MIEDHIDPMLKLLLIVSQIPSNSPTQIDTEAVAKNTPGKNSSLNYCSYFARLSMVNRNPKTFQLKIPVEFPVPENDPPRAPQRRYAT